MTTGERMVWAAGFVAALDHGHDAVSAASAAALGVRSLSSVKQTETLGVNLLTDEERAMLDDMLSTGADR